MLNPRYYTPIQQNQLLDANERRRNIAARYRAELDADPALPLRTLEMARAYPDLDPTLVAALAAQAVPVDTPAISGIAIRDAQAKEATTAQAHGNDGPLERIWSVAKGGVRVALTGADLLWEEGIARPTRAAVLAYQPNDLNFIEALMSPTSGESAGTAAVSSLFQGERVNLGEGFLPGSDLAPEVQEAVSQGLPLNVALEANREAQDPIGKPLTQLAREQQERTQVVHHGVNTGVSLGRLAVMGFDNINPLFEIEPDTMAFNVMSGAIDAGAQIAIDPAYRFAVPLAAARRATKTFQAARTAGGVIEGGARPGLLRRDAQQWLTSRPGRNVANRIAKETDSHTIWNMLRGAADKPIDPALVRRLTDTKTPAEVQEILGRVLGTDIRNVPVGTSLLSRATGERVPTISELVARGINPQLEGIGGVGAAFRGRPKNGYLRRLGTDRASTHVSVADPGRGMVEMDRFMTAAGLTNAQKAPFVDRWVRMTPGDIGTGQRIVDDMLNTWVDDIAAKGLDKKVAKRVVQRHSYLPELRRYAQNAVGDTERAPYLTRNIIIDGKTVQMPAPSKLAELSDMGATLPNPERVYAATRSQAKIGQFTTRITRNQSKDFQERALLRVASTVANAWKVSVLARMALTVRIVGEEQFRMAASGLDSALTNPLQWAAYAVGKGGKQVDVLGDDIAMAWSHKQAMSSADGFLGRGTAGSQNYRRVLRDEPNFTKDWLSSDLNHHFSDPVIRRVARRDYDGETFDDVTDWLVTGEGRVHLDDMLRARPDWLNPAGQVDRKLVDEWVRWLDADTHRVTGGNYRRLDRKNGTWIDGEGNATPATADDLASAPPWQVTEPGDDTLLAGIAEGNLFGVNVAGGLNDDGFKAVVKGLEDHVAAGGKAPIATKGAVEADKGMWESTVTKLFDFLVGHPSDKLSRSPAFSQFYWQRMAELMPYMDAKTAEAAAAAAARAGIGRKSWRNTVKDRLAVHPDPDVQDELRAARKALGDKADLSPESLRGRMRERDAQIGSLNDADEIAKSVALEEVQGLLYDHTRRRNAAWITKNIFPFGEAWAEIFSVWGKLLYQNPQTLRRFQQGMEGMRGEGWFYENENGEEMFAYPGGGLLSSALFSSAGVPLSVRSEGRIEGLNLAMGSFLPGVGPLVQVPAVWLIPDKPEWDTVRELVLPFGPNQITGPGDLANMVTPKWAQKLFAAVGLKDGELDRLFGSTVIDVQKALIATGEYDLQDPAEMQRLMSDAKTKAKFIYLFRGATQFGAPSAPQIVLEAQDKNGEWFAFQALTTEYRKLVDKNDGDSVAATDQFIQRFGFEPTPFGTAKSVQLEPRGVTAETVDFQRNNQDLFEKYPLTAYYLMPDDVDAEFDYTAWLRTIREGARKPLTPEEWLYTRNDLMGNVQYENIRRQLGEHVDTEEGRAALRVVRDTLINEYPGYHETIVGLPGRAQRDEKIRELDSWLTDDDSRLRDSEAGVAIDLYLRSRRKVVAQASASLGITETGFATSTRAAPFKKVLLQYGENLVGQYPQFSAVWSALLLGELREEENREAVSGNLLGQTYTSDDLIPPGAPS